MLCKETSSTNRCSSIRN